MRLTDLRIKQLKVPETGQRTHFDDALPGFGIRISQGGSKSFVVMFGKQRKLKTLGRYPTMSLADARREAKRIQADVEIYTAPVSGQSLAFSDARDRFLRDSYSRNKRRTAADYDRLLNRHFDYQQDIAAITRPDIMKALDQLQNTPSEQQHAFVAIRTLMNWCVRRGYLESSPVPPLRFQSQSRDRILTDEELRAVWGRAGEFGYPFGAIVQLLILTGQRRGEIGSLRRSWIEEDTIIFPAGFTKNKRQHRLPIGQQTQAIIAAIPETADLLFPSRSDPEKPYNGWSKSKRRFDKGLDLAPWTLHDLRRTYSSNLARQGVPIHITERLLNHASGAVSGVAAVYNRYTYESEMREVVNSVRPRSI